MNPHTVLVRYHGQPTPHYSIVSRTPVPILGLISNSLHVSYALPLDADKKVHNLVKSLEQLLDKAQVKLDVLFSGSLPERQAIEAILVNHTGIHLLP